MSKRKRLAALVMVLCLLAAAALCVLAVRELHERQASVNYYASLMSQVYLPTIVPTPDTPTTAMPTETVAPTATAIVVTETTFAATLSAVPATEATPTATLSACPTAEATLTATLSGTPEPSAAPSSTKAPTESPTSTVAVTPTNSPAPVVTETAPATGSMPPAPIATSTGTLTAASPVPAASPTITMQPTAVPTATPTQAPSPVPRTSQLDFKALSQLMPDIVGWIVCPGTNINYPIVQGEDNDFYLSHLPDGTANASGSIMLDVANAGDWSDQLSILHGHFMRSGEMFGSLDDFADPAYAAEHAVMQLYTPQGDYTVELLAACTVDGAKLGYMPNFEDDASLERFLAKLTGRSAYKTAYESTRNDQLLLLSTCAYSFVNARFMVLGRLIPQ
ncbi:MAG: sortase [Clostridia bacterium]|nr:sortase [Clostridia bacterium]